MPDLPPEHAVENDALLQLREVVADVIADERCNGLHPEDGGTCYRCREWAGIETRAMFERYAPASFRPLTEALMSDNAGKPAVEYAIQQADGRVDPTPSEEMGLRLVKNDPRRVLLRRTVTPWERVTPPGGDLTDIREDR